EKIPAVKPRNNSDAEPVTISASETEEVASAPVVHIADHDGALLVDYAYGAGRITLLGDPYIIANNGISQKDNLKLGINIATSVDGLVAFDEYHQGRGITQNEF